MALGRQPETPRPLTIAGTLLSLGGLVLVLDLTGAVKVDVIGVLWGIAAAVCLAIYFFITAKENDTLPPMVLASGGLWSVPSPCGSPPRPGCCRWPSAPPTPASAPG